MVFIFNTIIDTKAKDNFTQVITRRITFGKKYSVITLEESIPDLDKVTHLLISGSELSAAKESEWDEKIISLIHSFLKADKPILGICYGHQMLARAITGDNVCRRSLIPEFGWKKMNIKNNYLFENVTQPIFLESRYDEVAKLDDRFEIIASNEQLNVQAFQLKSKPVWGVQFHPEMLWDDGNKMVEKHLQDHPAERRYYRNETENPDLIKANLQIFRNFLSA